MKRAIRIIVGALEIIVVVYVALMTAILLCKNKFGYTQFGKYTLSSVDKEDVKVMKGVKRGDLLITYNSSNLKKGDLIYYYVVYDEKYVIHSSTIKEIEKDDFSSIYALDRDGILTVSSSRVLGKKKMVLHGFGSLLDILESRLGFLFLVLLPILIVFIYQIYELFILFKIDKTGK